MARLSGLKPLDRQMGIWPKASVIEALADPLFGPLPSAKAPVADHAAQSCYAVLDAAKITNLVEVLAASGKPHRCLFKGQAQETWGHVAPWLVRLDPDARLTRQLFTQGEGIFGLWDLQASLFVRSALPLDGLWRHLRKFSRIEDETGRWVYFRFWEAVSVRMLYLSRDLPGARAFFTPCPVLAAPLPDEDACLLVTAQPLPSQPLPPPALSPQALPPPALEVMP